MGLHRDIASLEPKTRDAAEKALAGLRGLGIKFWVNETLRDQNVQEAYYAQGRKPLAEINDLRAKAGLSPIGAAEAGKIITHTLKSNHSTGHALDIYPTGKGDVPLWGAKPDEFGKIAQVMKHFGFAWGGDWDGWKDYPHFEFKETP